MATEAAWAIAAMVVSLVGVALVMELWKASLGVPIFPASGDGNLTLASIKGVIEHGWYETNSNLGAPFGQVNHDYPLYIGELGSILEIKAMALYSSDVAVVLNMFVIVGYPLAALTGFLVLRALGFSRPVALVCAVLFALAPFHFVRAQFHLFRRRAEGRSWRTWLSTRTLVTLCLCLLVGIGGLYYAAFTCLLVAIAAPLTAIAVRRWTVLVAAIAMIVTIGIPLAATAAPEVLYRAEHGTDLLVAQRYPSESLIYALPPMQLVLPLPGDRIPILADLRSRYDVDDQRVILSEAPQGNSLGVVGTIGLVWLLVGLAAAGLGRPWREPLIRRTGTAALLAIVLGATAGAGALFALIVTPQIRGWDRIVILIMFFALIGGPLLLQRAAAALGGRRRGRLVAAARFAGTLCFGVFEGTTTSFVPPYAAEAAEWHLDGSFVAGIQHSLPRNAMVFELPTSPTPRPSPMGCTTPRCSSPTSIAPLCAGVPVR